MSHFTTLRTRIVDVDALVKALADVEYRNVEVHQTPQHLDGFLGDQREQTAEVIIRRQHVGMASNDMGFKRGMDGTFDAIISDYDRAKHSEAWLNSLIQRYAYHVSRDTLQKQGFKIATEEKTQDGKIRLVLRR